MARSPEEILANYREFAEQCIQAFDSATANPDVAASNLEEGLKCFLMQGLICWRCRISSPVDPFQKGLTFIRQGYAKWQGTTGTRQPVLEKGLFVAFLMNERPLAVDVRTLVADRRLDAILGEGLQGRWDEEAWASGLLQLQKLKGSALAVESYIMYRHLLHSSLESEIGASIEKAISLFEKRRGNGFYSGGEQTSGGGSYNPLTVDYRLAAIMKKLGHKSDSVHGWQWG